MGQVSYGTITITDIPSSGSTNQHFWFNPTLQGTLLAGAYITDTAIDTFKSEKSGGYLLARSDGLILGKASNRYMELEGSELKFYKSGTTDSTATVAANVAARLSSTGLEIAAGSITLGSNFSANSNGEVVASNITVNGGSIGGWRIGTDDAKSLWYGDSEVTIANPTLLLSKGLTISAANAVANAPANTEWMLKASNKFGVTTGGTLYTIDADVSGKITANSGYIGEWNIGTDTAKSLWYGNTIANPTLLLSKGLQISTANAVGDAAANTEWMLKASNKFGVTTGGKLYATDAVISGKIVANEGTIGGASIVNGTLQITDANVSGTLTVDKIESDSSVSVVGDNDYTYLSRTNNGVALAIGNSGTKTDWRLIVGNKFGVDSAGNVYATNAVLTGEITATSGTIGNWTIESKSNNAYVYGGALKTGTFGSSGGVLLTPAYTSSTSIGGSSGSKTWTMTAGSGFGVTTSGELYANEAHINGDITATSGTIGGCTIDSNGNLKITDLNIEGQISSNHINTSGLTISTDKIESGSNYAEISSNGLSIVRGGTEVANFGKEDVNSESTATIGKTGTDKFNLYITSTDLLFRRSTTNLLSINVEGFANSVNPASYITAVYGLDITSAYGSIKFSHVSGLGTDDYDYLDIKSNDRIFISAGANRTGLIIDSTGVRSQDLFRSDGGIDVDPTTYTGGKAWVRVKTSGTSEIAMGLNSDGDKWGIFCSRQNKWLIYMNSSGTTYIPGYSGGGSGGTDTKNTAGSSQDNSERLYIVGAKSQASYAQTFSNSKVYITTSNNIYSDGNMVVTTTTPTTNTANTLTVWNSNKTVTQGPAFGSSTTTYLRNDGTWATPSGSSSGVTSITTNAGSHSTKSAATGAVSFNVPTKTSHLTNDSGFVTSSGVTKITTSVGRHTAISNQTGAVSFNVPQNSVNIDKSDSNGQGNGIDFHGVTGTSTGRGATIAYVQSKTSSDKRLKKNITEIPTRVFDIYRNLSPIRYEFKEGIIDDAETPRARYGFIAQDVEVLENKYGAERVLTFDQLTLEGSGSRKYTGEYMRCLDYYSLHALHVMYAQMLEQKIITLENTVNQLTERISILEQGV